MRQAEFFAIVDGVLEDESGVKSGWWNKDAKWHLKRLKQEVGELERAMKSGSAPKVIQKEAADVVNFAYFLTDTYADDYSPPHNSPSDVSNGVTPIAHWPRPCFVNLTFPVGLGITALDSWPLPVRQ